MKRRYCRRCRAHGVLVLSKAHVKTCPYMSCCCYSCSRVATKNRNNAMRRYLRRQTEWHTNNVLKNVSFSSIEETQGLDLSIKSARSGNTSKSNKCSSCSNVLLVDVAVGSDTGHFKLKDQSTQTCNKILVIIMEDAEVTPSTNLTSPIINVTSNKLGVSLNDTDRNFLSYSGHFSFNDQSTQTSNDVSDMESVKLTTSNSTFPIAVKEKNQRDLTYKSTDREGIKGAKHFQLNDQSSQASSITIKTEPCDPTLSSHPTSPCKNVFETQSNDTSGYIKQYFSPDSEHSKPKDQSTNTRDNIILMESVVATSSNFSTSPITTEIGNRYDQEPEHIDQAVLKRFGCIPFSVVLQRLQNHSTY